MYVNVHLMVENVTWIKSGMINVEKNYICNSTTCSCENDEYLGSTTDESVIKWDEIINVADSVPKVSKCYEYCINKFS